MINPVSRRQRTSPLGAERPRAWIFSVFASKISRWIVCALLFVAAFIVYRNSLHNEFLWDDVTLVADNAYIKGWSHLPNIFTENIGAGAPNTFGDVQSFYRPLQMLSYVFDYQLWRLDPFGYHITNILLHAVTACLLYWLLTLLFGDLLLAFIASAFFTVHSIHTEAVTYVAGRADSMAALFLYASFIAYLYYSKNGRKGVYSLSLIMFCASLVCKEAVLVYPIILFAYEYVFHRDRPNVLRRVSPFLAVIAAYALMRSTVLRFHAAPLRGGSIDIFHRLGGFFASLASYIKLLLVPVGQHMEYGTRPFYFSEPLVIIGSIIFVFLVAAVIALRDRERVLSFASLWFVVNLLPMSGIVPLNTYMSEHWLYIPSLGFFLAAAYFLLRLMRSSIKPIRYAGIVVCVGAFLFYGYRTVEQNGYWKDAPTFFTTTIKYIDDRYKPEMYYNLGLYYKKKDMLGEAEENYLHAIAINPAYFAAYNNLGSVYATVGYYEKALEFYRRAATLQPNNPIFLANLCKAYIVTGRYDEAAVLIVAIGRLSPNTSVAGDLRAMLENVKNGRGKK